MTTFVKKQLPEIEALGPTAVYDAYWHFAAERQEIFERRRKRLPPPWTDDPVLLTNKFTNVYRASDRISQYLIRNVIYTPTLFDADDIVFRILLFKIFNKIETWELLTFTLGSFLIRALRGSGESSSPCFRVKFGMSICASTFRQEYRQNIGIPDSMYSSYPIVWHIVSNSFYWLIYWQHLWFHPKS